MTRMQDSGASNQRTGLPRSVRSSVDVPTTGVHLGSITGRLLNRRGGSSQRPSTSLTTSKENSPYAFVISSGLYHGRCSASRQLLRREHGLHDLLSTEPKRRIQGAVAAPRRTGRLHTALGSAERPRETQGTPGPVLSDQGQLRF